MGTQLIESCKLFNMEYQEYSYPKVDLRNSANELLKIISTPIKFVLGTIQCLAFLLITFCKGLFYKTKFKGYIIDNWILSKSTCSKQWQDDVAQRIETGDLHQVATSYLLKNEKNKYECVVFEHKTEDAGKKDLSKKWIVYVPGMCGSWQGSIDLLHKIYKGNQDKSRQYNVICTNQLGVGKSTEPHKAHTINSLAKSVLITINHLKVEKKVASKDIILWGHSLGGAIAANAIATHAIRENDQPEQSDEGISLILDRSFNTFTKAAIAVDKFIFFPFNRLLAFIVKNTIPFDTEKNLEFCKKNNIKIINCKSDEIVKFDTASAIKCKKSDNRIKRRIVDPFNMVAESKIFDHRKNLEFRLRTTKYHTAPWSNAMINDILANFVNL